MKYNTSKVVLILFLLTALISGCSRNKEVRKIFFTGCYNRDFNDLNDVQLKTAKKIGIKPLKYRKDVKKQKKLVEIKENKTFVIDKLTHSVPFLIKDSKILLEDIGRAFQDSLKSHNAPLYKLHITSVTRTIEDVRKLNRRNINSTLRSTHMYGTTVDISWKRFTKIKEKDKRDVFSEDLKQILAMVLKDLKKEGRCFVKHERKQGCFHITVKD